MHDRETTTRIPWRMLGVLLLVSLVLGVLSLTWPPHLTFLGSLIGVLTALYSLLLALLCFQGSPRLLRTSRSPTTQKQGGQRFVPALLGIGLVCLTLGQCVRLYEMMTTHQEPTYPSLFHFIYLGWYPFAIAACLLLPSQTLSLFSRLRILLDSLMIITTVITLYCFYLLVPILVLGSGPLLQRIVGSLFTTADLILFFCLLLVALRSRGPVLQRVVVLLGLSMLTAIPGHLAYLLGLLSSTYNVTIRANASTLFGLALIAVAAQIISRSMQRGELVKRGSPVLLEETQSTRWKVFLMAAQVSALGLLIVSLWKQEEETLYHARWAVAGSGIILFLVLLVLRQFLYTHELNSLKQNLREKNEQLDQLAASDPLTGIPNHRTLVARLAEALVRAKAQQTTCSVLFMDIDHFKAINDQHGHAVGDLVLCQIAGLAASLLHPEGCLGRWGGEEFVAVLPGKDLQEAFLVAELIRMRVSEQVFPGQDDFHVTCSFGGASYPQAATSQDGLLDAADQALYEAKRLGRNQTRLAGPKRDTNVASETGKK